MGETEKRPFQLSFNSSLRVEFQGARVTSDGGLILVRELDERLGLSELVDPIPKQEADQAREAQLARLQALRMLLWNQASADPIRAAEALIKLEAREARLLGLDMPTKVAVTDPDGGGIPLESVRRVLERVDRQMVDVTLVPAPLPLDHKRQ